MKHKIAIMLVAGVVLMVMMSAMSPGVAIGAKAGGVVAKSPPEEGWTAGSQGWTAGNQTAVSQEISKVRVRHKAVREGRD